MCMDHSLKLNFVRNLTALEAKTRDRLRVALANTSAGPQNVVKITIIIYDFFPVTKLLSY